ncbi:TPA: type III pantothenate kinase [Candidatus Poribacteria bacterium]|nr:type III pantothenate kinase [Candidatus Poribacteria bacterium]
MLLTVDIGNTITGIGVFEGRRLISSWRISTDNGRQADEYGALISFLFQLEGIDRNSVEGVIISSVVPAVLPNIVEMSVRYLKEKPVVVTPQLDLGLRFSVKNPSEVGADRIVNAIGAFEEYGGPCVVVDFGTATTFDVISSAGEYLGGAIAPGIGISMEALFSRAAKLPKVELIPPPSPIGNDTITSIQSGFFYGFLGQTEEIVRRISNEMIRRGEPRPKVIATGGLARLIADSSTLIEIVDPDLTLRGLRIAYERVMRHGRDLPL